MADKKMSIEEVQEKINTINESITTATSSYVNRNVDTRLSNMYSDIQKISKDWDTEGGKKTVDTLEKVRKDMHENMTEISKLITSTREMKFTAIKKLTDTQIFYK